MVKSFRVWDNQFGLFVKKGLYLSIDGSIGEIGHVSKEFIPAEKDRYSVCFNSGFRDIYNQELYECDIVQVKIFDDFDNQDGIVNNYVLLYSPIYSAFGLYAKASLSYLECYSGINPLTLREVNQCKLIGNMFENADCL